MFLLSDLYFVFLLTDLTFYRKGDITCCSFLLITQVCLHLFLIVTLFKMHDVQHFYICEMFVNLY